MSSHAANADSHDESIPELEQNEPQNEDMRGVHGQFLQAPSDFYSSHPCPSRKRSRSPSLDAEGSVYRPARKSVNRFDHDEPNISDNDASHFSNFSAAEGKMESVPPVQQEASSPFVARSQENDLLPEDIMQAVDDLMSESFNEVDADNDSSDRKDGVSEETFMDQQKGEAILPGSDEKNAEIDLQSSSEILSVESFLRSVEDGSQVQVVQPNHQVWNDSIPEMDAHEAPLNPVPTIIVDDCSSSNQRQSPLPESMSISLENSAMESDVSNSASSSNSTDSSEEEEEVFTVEAREERLLEKYRQCLESIRDLSLFSGQPAQESHVTSVVSKFKSILEETIELERDDSTIDDDRMKYLSYVVLKNLSGLSELIGDTKGALDHLLSAAEYYYKDVAMIHQMGELAVKLENYPFAASLFQDALSIRNTHWPSLDAIITLLYAMNHTQTCLSYCLMALKLAPTHVRTLTITRRILEDHEEIRSDWVYALKQASTHVDKSKPASVKKYIEEAEVVREKWTKPGLKLEKPEHLEIPSLETLTLEELGKALMNCLTVADETKKWTSPLLVTLPELPNSQPPSDAGMDVSLPAEGSVTGSSSGIDGKVPDVAMDSDSQSQNPDDAGVPKASEPTKPRSRKLDPVLLEHAEKRRSARNNKAGTKSEEEAIREMLGSFLAKLFPDFGDNGTESSSGQATRLALSGAQPRSLSPLLSKPLFKEDCPGAESLVVRSLMADMNGKLVLVAVRMMLQFLAEKWDTCWQTPLVKFYRSGFPKVCNFDQLPQYLNFRPGMENRVRRAIYFTLMGAELLVDEWMNAGKVRNPPPKFDSQMDFLSAWPFSGELTESEDRPLHLRILFLMYKWHSLKGETEEMQSYLRELSTRLDPTEKISMPNLIHKTVVSKALLESWLSSKLIISQLDDLKKYGVEERFDEAIKLGEKLFFEGTDDKRLADLPLATTHIIPLLRAVELQDDVNVYSRWSQKLLEHAFARWNYICSEETGDSEKKVEARCTLLDIVDVAVRFYKNHKFSCQMDLATLRKWASTVTDVCVISVHTVDGNIKKPGILAPWVLLYWILVRRERELSNTVNCSLNYLEEVHSYLGEHGPHGWCTIGNGSFLVVALERFWEEWELKKSQEGNSNDRVLLEDLQFDIEQCFYCLYGFANPDNRLLKQHNCREVELTLSAAARLYSYFEPSELPGFDSPKNDCIPQEFVAMFNKIQKLKPNVPFALSRDDILSYIRSFDPFTEMPELPRRPSPMKSDEPESVIFRSFYYLLADHHLKNGENEQASKLYMSDLRINPDRFDSWAGLALNRSALVESKFRSFALKPSKELMEEAKEAVQCYAIALKLRPDCEQLAIECGTLIYTMQTYVSRQINQAVQYAIPKEDRPQLRRDKEALLLLVQKYMTKAEEASERNEPWLPQYLMGKALEKLERSKPWKYLARYTAAAHCLHESDAHYPQKIAYYKPPDLALEALELHYRVFASSLKFLSKSNSKLSDEEMCEALAAIDFYMGKAENGNFAGMCQKTEENEDEPEWDGATFVCDQVMHTILDQLDIAAVPRRGLAEWKADLIERAIKGLRLCLRRYPEHYKSIYRLARYCYEATSVKNHLAITRDLLLGSCQDWQQVPHMPCPGLFSQRKPTMFFKGIWHIRSDEVQRQLSFASHMYRSVLLAIKVLYDLRDNSLLLLICQQLMKPPTSDAKRFLRLNDYSYLADMALRHALLSMINRIEDYEDAVSEDQQVLFLREVLKLWTTAKKEQQISRKNRRLCDVMLAQTYLRLVEGIHRDQCPVGDVDVSPEIICRAMKYIQQAQVRAKPVPKPVTVNLSTGLVEEPEVEPTNEATDDPAKDPAVQGGKTIASNDEPDKNGNPCDRAQDVDAEADADDLTGLDLGINMAGMNIDMSDLDLNMDAP